MLRCVVVRVAWVGASVSECMGACMRDATRAKVRGACRVGGCTRGVVLVYDCVFA